MRCAVGRQWCDAPGGCGEELIHRDHRKPYESSSGFGQIIHRDYGRGAFAFADVDLVLYRRPPTFGSLAGPPLLVILEHKEATAEIGWSQGEILRCLATVIHMSILEHRLAPSSGVYVVRGRIGARENGRRETFFDGPQQIERMLPRRDNGAHETWEVASQGELFSWLDRLHGQAVTARRGVMP